MTVAAKTSPTASASALVYDGACHSRCCAFGRPVACSQLRHPRARSFSHPAHLALITALRGTATTRDAHHGEGGSSPGCDRPASIPHKLSPRRDLPIAISRTRSPGHDRPDTIARTQSPGRDLPGAISQVRSPRRDRPGMTSRSRSPERKGGSSGRRPSRRPPPSRPRLCPLPYFPRRQGTTPAVRCHPRGRLGEGLR